MADLHNPHVRTAIEKQGRDLIVVRCPEVDGFVKEGWWYNIANAINVVVVISGSLGLPEGNWQLVPTGLFEMNDSGEVAEVWHVVRQ